MTERIFKILTLPQWETLQATHSFAGSRDDKRDGYIHLSGAGQVQATLDKHYSFAKVGGADLVLAEVNESALSDAIKYEPARGQMFPHLYGDLPLAAVLAHWPLRVEPNDLYDVSAILEETA